MRLATFLITSLLVLSPVVAAASPPEPQSRIPQGSPMPPWDQLTAEQRALLLAPIRERWDDNPQQRARMYRHARRWHDMTPEQRTRANHGLQRWRRMDPQQREQARALFGRMREMTPQQRQALRDKWKAMTPGQRRAWMEQNTSP